jgi:hypothetical protein
MNSATLHQELWIRDAKMHCHNPVRVIEKLRKRIVVASIADPKHTLAGTPAGFSKTPIVF